MAMRDYAASGSTYQRLLSLYPAEAENVITYTASTASRALTAHRYQQALDVSALWLTLRPNERDALTIEADAELALGKFSAAAKAYRNLLDLTPKDSQVDVQLVWGYADALSAANLGPSAVQDFHSFMLADRTVSNTTIENQIKIEYAGLALMAGDSALARDLVDEPRGVRGSWIPRRRGPAMGVCKTICPGLNWSKMNWTPPSGDSGPRKGGGCLVPHSGTLRKWGWQLLCGGRIESRKL
jgi:hypothetical protein